MRLNELNGCFDDMAPDFEQKRRMLDAILERKDENGGIISMKYRTKRLVAAVVLAAALVLVATTALAVGYGWHERFIEYFGIREGQTDLLEGAVSSPEMSITKNGVTVEVLQTLADSQGVYVIFEVTVPTGVELTEDTMFFSTFFVAETEQRSEGVRISASGWEVLYIAGNKMTMLANCNPADPIISGTLSLSLKDLGHVNRPEDFGPDSGTPFVTVIEGEWLLEWDFTYIDTTKKVLPNQTIGADDDSIVTEISISPISICVYAEGPSSSPLEDLLIRGSITVEFRDGSSLVYSAMDTNSLFGRSIDSADAPLYRYRMFNRFSSIIDLEDVVSVTLCGVTIPLG